MFPYPGFKRGWETRSKRNTYDVIDTQLHFSTRVVGNRTIKQPREMYSSYLKMSATRPSHLASADSLSNVLIRMQRQHFVCCISCGCYFRKSVNVPDDPDDPW